MNFKVELLCAFVVSCGFAKSHAEAPTAPTEAEKSAMRVIQRGAEGISSLAYPSVTFTKCEYDEGTRFKDGSFRLRYTFHGKWLDTRGKFTQDFYFTKKGKLHDVRNRGESWLFRPFDEWEIARGLVRGIFEEELKKQPELSQVVQNASGKKVLITLLNVELGF